MKISTTSRYGLRAMVYLAKTNKVCSIKEISQNENISAAYLEKIFAKLKKAGLIKVKRGVRGGHSLLYSPKKISVGEIVATLEKPIVNIPCLAFKNVCPRSKQCLTKDVWGKVQQIINSTLDSITLADLITLNYRTAKKSVIARSSQ